MDLADPDVARDQRSPHADQCPANHPVAPLLGGGVVLVSVLLARLEVDLEEGEKHSDHEGLLDAPHAGLFPRAEDEDQQSEKGHDTEQADNAALLQRCLRSGVCGLVVGGRHGTP